MDSVKKCGFHQMDVKVSKYNGNGTCKCLGCKGGHCHTCEEYEKRLDGSWEERQKCVARCMDCLNQKSH